MSVIVVLQTIVSAGVRLCADICIVKRTSDCDVTHTHKHNWGYYRLDYGQTEPLSNRTVPEDPK